MKISCNKRKRYCLLLFFHRTIPSEQSTSTCVKRLSSREKQIPSQRTSPVTSVVLSILIRSLERMTLILPVERDEIISTEGEVVQQVTRSYRSSRPFFHGEVNRVSGAIHYIQANMKRKRGIV